jgi:hypothetical protein
MNYIMNYAFSNLLQLAQYTVHSLRDLNNIYAEAPTPYTTEFPNNFM